MKLGPLTKYFRLSKEYKDEIKAKKAKYHMSKVQLWNQIESYYDLQSEIESEFAEADDSAWDSYHESDDFKGFKTYD